MCIDEIVLIDITEKFSDNFIDTIKFFFRMFVPLTIMRIKKLSDEINYLKLVLIAHSSHSIKDIELIYKISLKYGNHNYSIFRLKKR